MTNTTCPTCSTEISPRDALLIREDTANYTGFSQIERPTHKCDTTAAMIARADRNFGGWD